MLKQFEGARLGIFIFLGTVLFVIAVFMLGNKESMFVSTINVSSIFEDVDGLKTGAPVRLSGMDIGAVTEVALVPDNSGLVKVEMRIENDVRHLIRLNSKATIGTEGLVGKKIVMVSPGSVNYDIVKDGGSIKSDQPTSMTEIFEKAETAIDNFNTISKNFSSIISKIDSGKGTIGMLVNNEDLYHSAVNITSAGEKSLMQITQKMDDITNFFLNMGTDVDTILTHVDGFVVDMKSIVNKIDRGEGAIGALVSDESTADSIKTIITNLANTTHFAVKGLEGFSENMEALKHNWLFKSYFEQRGYWSKSEYDMELEAKLQKIEDENKKLQQRIDELKKLEEKLDVD